jgi:hypothetical protein
MENRPGGKSPAGEVLYELTQIGHQTRVAAIDVTTGLEVVVIAPTVATQMQMRALALAKLRRRLADE